MKKRIWINQDPKRADIQLIAKKLNDAGFDAYVKLLSGKTREYVEEGKNADGILAGLEPWDREALSQLAGKTSVIIRKGAGYDSVDVNAATEYGIAVLNLPGANATAVAEVAFLHIMNCSRHFSWSMKKQDSVRPVPVYKGHELDSSTVGILGYGNIGRELARMLSGFETNVLVYDSNYTPEPLNEKMTVAASMEEVFEKSDYISLHIPCIPETEKIINRNVFEKMKSTAYIINTSRGGVIDEDDLIEALKNNVIAGAGLDVTVQEPLPLDSPLLKLENAWVTPHIAGNTIEAVERQNNMAVDCFIRFFNGEKLRNVINKEVLR